MRILGISCFYHDASAALIEDGKIIAAADEERFTRVKHDFSYPKKAIEFCLNQLPSQKTKIDYVVFYEKPLVKFERILLSAISTFPKSLPFFRNSMHEWLGNKLWLKSYFASQLEIDSNRILFCEHHLSHASSCFYPSPFRKSAILTIDGVGEWTTATIAQGELNKVKIVKELKFPHSVGLLYSTFTAFLGFEVNEGEYKMMGMAAFGKPKYVDKVKQVVKVFPDGSIKLNLDYFTHQFGGSLPYSEKFISLFGAARSSKNHFFTRNSGYPDFFGSKPADFEYQAKSNEYYADIASSIQKVTEEIILRMANYAISITQSQNLCLAGGVALNSVANSLIEKQVSKNIFIQPAAGDNGGALGAALYLYHHVLGYKNRERQHHAFLGEKYMESEIKKILKLQKIEYTYVKNEISLIKMIISCLKQEKIVGWFHGKFEWGPRALGHRSILADPRNPKMKNIVNTKIKFREPFRPFAPSVLEEKVDMVFDFSGKTEGPARFMTTVARIKDSWKKKIPAVTHVDGTGRLQTVEKRYNSRYYRLIAEFYKQTGVPLILNTSFNLKGEPMVASPNDALSTFSRCGMDILVLENFVISKK